MAADKLVRTDVYLPPDLVKRLDAEVEQRRTIDPRASRNRLIIERLTGPQQPSGDAQATQGSQPAAIDDQVSESSDSPFRPVCIWPNIKDWSKDEDSGEWSKKDYDCPIRVEQRNITSVELSKNHCTKCPIFRTYEIKQRKKSRGYRRSSEPGVGRPISERYPNLYRGGFNGAQAMGWSPPR